MNTDLRTGLTPWGTCLGANDSMELTSLAPARSIFMIFLKAALCPSCPSALNHQESVIVHSQHFTRFVPVAFQLVAETHESRHQPG